MKANLRHESTEMNASAHNNFEIFSKNMGRTQRTLEILADT